MTSDLGDLMDRYLAAMTANDASSLPVAGDVRVTENGYPIELGQGLFETATDVTYRHVVTDPTAGQIAALSVVQEGPLLANVAIRLSVDGDEITGIETVVARKGTSSVARPDKLHAPKPIFRELLDPSERHERAELVAIADRYFEAIEHNTADVPFHPECNRTANGQRTTNVGPAPLSCLAQFERKIFAYITRVRDRRFTVIDEERGLVFGTFLMDVPGRKEDFASFPIPYERLPEHLYIPHTIMLAELFKITGGQIREIEALMVNVALGATSGW